MNVPIETSFGGQTAGMDSVLLKYAWYGDMDLNEEVNGDDYYQIDTGFLAYFRNDPELLVTFRNGDVDGNKAINADDYSYVDRSYLWALNHNLSLRSGGGGGVDGSTSLPILADGLQTSYLPGLTIELVEYTGLKQVQVTGVGQIISLDVYATVTGIDPNKRQSFQSIHGAFLSSNLSGGAALGTFWPWDLGGGSFGDYGSSVGTQQDLDADGDPDLGGGDAGSADGWWIARSAGMRSGSPGLSYTWYPGSIDFEVTSLLSGGTTELNFMKRPDTESAALWRQDGGDTSNGFSEGFYIGAPVMLTL